jgi:hypothetical protein
MMFTVRTERARELSQQIALAAMERLSKNCVACPISLRGNRRLAQKTFDQGAEEHQPIGGAER